MCLDRKKLVEVYEYLISGMVLCVAILPPSALPIIGRCPSGTYKP